MLTSDDLQSYLDANNVEGEILFLDVPTPTVETAARAVGSQVRQIVKSILFIVKEQPVLAIACGTDRVDQRTIASLYSVGRKQVKLASPDLVVQIAGYEVGAMPPFGHRQTIKTLLDQRVLEQNIVYAGGGAENALLRLSPDDILRVTRAQVMDLILNSPG